MNPLLPDDPNSKLNACVEMCSGYGRKERKTV